MFNTHRHKRADSTRDTLRSVWVEKLVRPFSVRLARLVNRLTLVVHALTGIIGLPHQAVQIAKRHISSNEFPSAADPSNHECDLPFPNLVVDFALVLGGRRLCPCASASAGRLGICDWDDSIAAKDEMGAL